MSIYVTGDTHGDFGRVWFFCNQNQTTKDDILIILGDAGINFSLGERDKRIKRDLVNLPITLFCIHGNHEQRPYLIEGYIEKEWHDGIVYYEPEYPNLLFAKDGEIYDFDGRSYIALGGAYSVDKYYRLRYGYPWYESELPTQEIMDYVKSQLEKVHWKVYGVLSHSVPIQYEPTWAFLSGIDQSLVDKTTENWLSEIEGQLLYLYWFAGHYHVESQEGPVRIMYEEIAELP